MRERYSEICQALNVGYWQINFDEKQIHLDNHLQEQLQFTHPTINLEDFFDLIIPTEREAIKTAIQLYPDSQSFSSLFGIRNEKGAFTLEAVLNSPTFKRRKLVGAEGYIRIAGRHLSSQGSSTSPKAIGVLHDITEHIKTQTEQGKSEQLLLEAKKEIESAIADRNLALDNLNTALVYMNRDFVVQWNSMKTMKSILGKNAYAVGEPCYKSTFNRDSPCPDCPVAKLFKSKKPEMHRIERNKEILEVMANPVFNEKKELIGGVLKLDKITDRVKQENLITELNTLMGAILNHIPVYLYVKDPNNDFKYLYWNKALAESMRIPSSNVVGRTDHEILLNKKDAKSARKNDLDLLKSRGQIYSIEEYQDANADTKIVSSLKTLIPAPNGKLPWILGISWDITELKKNERELIHAKEKAEESNRLKSAFLANMSHEIRTPLNAIVGFSDLLLETEEQEEKTEYIDIIKSNNELLLQLISDILDLSKIEAQSLDFVYETVDIYDMVNQTVAAGNLNARAKVPVILDKHEHDFYMYTDKNRVSQILLNFINNALKFTSEGDIRVGYHKTEQNSVKFYVRDTGTGIESTKLQAVFERFVKLDNFKQGTGLGLSICKSIVEELKGDIGVESEVGQGSCFWFTLPYENETKKKPDRGNPQKKQKRIVSKIHVKNEGDEKPTILVAEDLDSNYLLVDKSLKSSYNLIRAYNGKEAVELYNKLKPDMILMDIMMPEMDGLQATRKIRKKDQQIPIIAYSAYSYNANDEKARKAGCDDFIAKPVTATKLREKINSYIQSSYSRI